MIPIEFGDWPGRIVFGVGAVAQLRDIVARHGGSRALVLCGTSGLLDKVKAGLGDSLVSLFAEVSAHTPVEMVARALAQFRDSGADCVITVGGGSTIDADKAICLTLATGGDLEPYAIRYKPGGVMERQPLPASKVLHIAVPTTAGSASDVMPTAACRDPQSRRKLLFWDDVLIPKVTVLDPEMAVAPP